MKLQKIIAIAIHMCSLKLFAQPNVVAWGGGRDPSVTNIPINLSNAVSVASDLHVCVALLNDGTIRAWGSNQAMVLTQVSNVVQVSIGWQGVVLLADGTMQSIYGASVPSFTNRVASVSVGGRNSVALLQNGQIAAWGSGPGTNVPPLTNVTAVASGSGFCMALLSDGSVKVWGNTLYGVTTVPADVTNVVAISAGGEHCVVLKRDGTVEVWGGFDSAVRSVPVSATNIVSIAAGGWHTLALSAGGSTFAWGDNSYKETNVPAGLPIAYGIAAATNFSGIIDSSVSSKPLILALTPTNQNISIGGTGYITAHVVGFAPINYQWYFGSNIIVGATNRTLVVSNMQLSDSGSYHVEVANSAGPATSSEVTINVFPGLGISMTPTITMFGQIGSNYELDYMNQLGPTDVWKPVAYLVITSNPQLFFDTTAIGQPSRLYRLVQLP